MSELDHDRVFAALVQSHAGLDVESARAFDARLILLLIDRVGETGAVLAAIEAARRRP